MLVHHILQLGCRYHVFQCVVERLQIGVDLVLHVAGQKAQLLASLDGRTRQDNLLGVLLLHSLYGEGYTEIGFAGTGRSHGEYHVVLVERVYQKLLVFRTALDRSARERIDHNILHGIGLGRLALDDVEYVLIVQTVIFQNMFSYGFNIFFGFGHFFLIAEKTHHIIASHYAQFREQRLYHLQVAVVYPIEYEWVDIF